MWKKRCILAILAACLLSGCSMGGNKGVEVPDLICGEMHENTTPGIELSGDFSVTYSCYVEHDSGTLDASELELDLHYDGTTLHMPMFSADPYLEQEDGTVYEFTDEEYARGRKEPGSVYSSNKVPSSGVELTITLGRAGDVLTGTATYEGGAMGKGNHQFWIFHYYGDPSFPEAMVLEMSGEELKVSEIAYTK